MATTGKKKTGLQKRRWGDGLRLLEWVVLEGSCNSIHHRTEKERPFQHTHPHHLNQPSYPISSSSPNSTIPNPSPHLALALYTQICQSHSSMFHNWNRRTNGRAWPRGSIYCSSRVGLEHKARLGYRLMCSNFNNNILLKKFKRKTSKNTFYIFLRTSSIHACKILSFFLKKKRKH